MSPTKRSVPDDTFSADERAAMKAAAKESRARTKGAKAEDDLRAALDAIAAMDGADRALCSRLHEVITTAAPELAPRTWYGMPAYAKDGKVLCFVQNAGKFKARYTTLGFQDTASLDDGPMWATAYAVTTLTTDVEERVADLVRRAVG